MNGSVINGVTGLRTSDGKSRMLGDRISGLLRGENPEEFGFGLGLKPGRSGLILKFLTELRLS